MVMGCCRLFLTLRGLSLYILLFVFNGHKLLRKALVKECTSVVGSSGECKKNKSHHGPAVSRFLVSNGSTIGTGCLRGLLRLIKTNVENISGSPF